MADDVLRRLGVLIRDLLPEMDGEIEPDARFDADLGLDSLNVVDLLSDVEREFDLEIPDDRLDDLDRVGRLADFIVATRATGA